MRVKTWGLDLESACNPKKIDQNCLQLGVFVSIQHFEALGSISIAAEVNFE